MRVLTFYKTLSETSHILKRIQNNINSNVIDLHVKHPLFLPHINETWIFLAEVEKHSNFI